MNRNYKLEWIKIAGMLLAMGITIGLDALASTIRNYAASTFQTAPSFVFIVLSPIARGAIYLALAWLFFFKGRPGWLSSAIYTALGLLIVTTPVWFSFSYFPPLWALIRWGPLGWFRMTILAEGTRSSLLQLGGFLLVVGIVGIGMCIRNRQKRNA